MTGGLNMNSQNITNVGSLNGRVVSTLFTEHDANKAKVSADGSIDTHSDVIITTPANGQLLTYNGSNWVNSTGSLAFLALSGGTMTGDVTMGASAFTLYTAPQAMTSNNSGGFVASASNEYNLAYYAFNASQNDYWTTAIYYNDATGVYSRVPATTNTWRGTPYTGEYIKIDLGATYRIKNYYVRSSSANYIETTPSIWYVGVSTDNITYTLWDSRSGEAWASQTTKTYTPVSNASARYIIFIVNKTGSGGTSFRSQPRIASLYFDYETFNYDITLIRDITSNTRTTSGAITASALITANAGLTGTTLTASGLITANAGDDAKSKKITNLLTPTASTDGANKSYVDTLDGQNVKLTGDQTMSGTKEFSGKLATSLGIPCIVGRNTKGTAATGGLELYGTASNLIGGHIQAFVHSSVYPIFQQLNWNQDNIFLNFDCYYDNSNWKSSNLNSNFQIYKISNKLSFLYATGVAVGGTITLAEAMGINTSGEVVIPTASSGFLTMRKRPSYTYDPQIFMKSGGYSNYAVVCASTGTFHAWTTSNSTGELSGSCNYVPLNGAWTNSSDRRLKSNIKTLDCGDCCEKLTKINCCSYYWKTDEKKEKKNHGFNVDEVKKIFPEFVSKAE